MKVKKLNNQEDKQKCNNHVPVSKWHNFFQQILNFKKNNRVIF